MPPLLRVVIVTFPATQDGETPLHLAVKVGSAELTSFLLSAGCSANSTTKASCRSVCCSPKAKAMLNAVLVCIA